MSTSSTRTTSTSVGPFKRDSDSPPSAGTGPKGLGKYGLQKPSTAKKNHF